MRKLTDYKPTKFMAEDAHYDKAAADYAVGFIEEDRAAYVRFILTGEK